MLYLMISLVVGFTTITGDNLNSSEFSSEFSPEISSEFSPELSQEGLQTELARAAALKPGRRCYAGQFSHHESSCLKYYTCQNNKFVERKCDFGIWNNKLQRCEFSRKCMVRTNKSWHSFIVPDCTKNKNQNKYFPHPFDCHKFYRCVKSKLIERECGNGRQWDQLNSNCKLLNTCEAAIPKVPPFARRMQHIPNSGVETKNNIKKDCDDDDDSGDEDDYTEF